MFESATYLVNCHLRRERARKQELEAEETERPREVRCVMV